MDSKTEQRKPNHRLSRERRARGWTQRYVAEQLGADPNIVSRWESGERPPGPYYHQKLCELFGKNAKELGLIEEQENRELDSIAASLVPQETTSTQPPRNGYVAFERRNVSLFVDVGGYTSASSPEDTTLVLEKGEPLTVVQGVPVILLHADQAIDLLRDTSDATPEQKLGTLLALEANELATFFDEGWSIEDLLGTLRVVLQGAQAMPKFSRRTFGRKLLKLGTAAILSGIPIPEGRHISAEDLTKLHSALGESIAAGWNLFSTAGNAQVLAIGQAQLFLLKQNHSLLHPSVLPMFYSATYRLIGAALFFQQHYEEAHHEHNCSYMAALESADGWNMAQSRIWQAYGYQVRGRHAEAIQFIEAALRLTMEPNDETHRRLRSHLLALWAENATMLKEYTTADVQEKLEASLALLDGIAPNEEFDRAHWHQKAGNCALAIKDYPAAIRHFKEAQEELLPHLTMRQAVTLIPLAIAHARIGERDASLTIAKRAVPLISTLKAPLLNRQFVEYIRGDLLRLFPNDARTFIADIRHQLPQITAVVGQESKRKE